ncbi:MAG: thioredoxin [Anaerolineaceae bacterium]
MMSLLAEISQTEFDDQVLQSKIPVVVEFGAEWCGPCKRLEPELVKLAGEWKDKIKIMHVNVDENLDLSTQFQIMSVPTTILFLKGKEVQRLIGFIPLQKMKEKFLSSLS